MTLMEVRGFDGSRNIGALDLSGDADGAVRVVPKHGTFRDANARGAMFRASNQAAQAVSVALATTYTGLCLSNPISSAKRLHLRGVGIALTVAPAAIASLHLIGGHSAVAEVVHTAALTPRATRLGLTSTPEGKADSQATIPAPEYLWSLGSGFTAGALPSHTPLFIDMEGLFSLDPGGFIAIGALTAVTGIFSMAWEEELLP